MPREYIYEKRLQPPFFFWLLGYLGVKSSIFHINKIHTRSSQGSHYVSRIKLPIPRTKESTLPSPQGQLFEIWIPAILEEIICYHPNMKSLMLLGPQISDKHWNWPMTDYPNTLKYHLNSFLQHSWKWDTICVELSLSQFSRDMPSSLFHKCSTR